jgi:O-antigen/teichoic acid export membrane protein
MHSPILAQQKMKTNGHISELFKGSALALLVKLLAAISVFLMNLVVARNLGVAESGLFFLAMTCVVILSAISRLGLDNSVVRFVASSFVGSNNFSAYSVYQKAIKWATISGIIWLALLLLTNDLITKTIFNQNGFGDVLYIMVFAIPIIGLYTLHGYALQGIKKVVQSMMTLNVIAPISLLLLIVAFNVSTAAQVAYLYIASTLIALSFGVFWWKICYKKEPHKTNFPSKDLLSSCLPLLGVAIANQLILWSSQLMLGVWGSAEDVALFSVAQRTAMLTSFVLVAINAIAAPKFSTLYKSGDMENLRLVSLMSTRLMVIFSMPVLTVMLFFPEVILSLFGKEYKNADTTLMILAFGQFINVSTGSVGYLLTMSGNERLLQRNLIIGAGLSITLGITLIPLYGLIGGAIATAIGVASQNLLGVVQVRKKLGFNTMLIWRKR